MRRQSRGGSERTLRTAGLEVPLVVTGSVQATPGARRRLAELGVREGAHVLVRSRTAGGGVILAVGDGRIALSGRLLTSIPVAPEPAPHAAPESSAQQTAETTPSDPAGADS